MIVHGIDVYRTYLAFKQHFSNPKFDFFQYDGKVKAKETTYQQRSDFYFFETMARKHSDQEIKEFMLASFVSAEDPSKVWIGDIKRTGKTCWLAWQKQQASLSYVVQQDCQHLVKFMEEHGRSFNSLFQTSGGHPKLLKLHIKQEISLITIIIMDMVLGFIPMWDKDLRDPLWEQLSFKIRKYKPFLSIQTDKYRMMLREMLCE